METIARIYTIVLNVMNKSLTVEEAIEMIRKIIA